MTALNQPSLGRALRVLRALRAHHTLRAFPALRAQQALALCCSLLLPVANARAQDDPPSPASRPSEPADPAAAPQPAATSADAGAEGERPSAPLISARQEAVAIRVLAAADATEGQTEFRRRWVGSAQFVDRWRPLEPGFAADAMLELRTGPGAYALLEVGGPTLLRADRLTRLAISRLTLSGTSAPASRLTIELTRGRVIVSPRAEGLATPVLIITPEGTVSVREPTEVAYDAALGLRTTPVPPLRVPTTEPATPAPAKPTPAKPASPLVKPPPGTAPPAPASPSPDPPREPTTPPPSVPPSSPRPDSGR
jgi:hypothetical protein